jgi:NADH:ubiquinone oxidoreductase subunit 6 (subunit J)
MGVQNPIHSILFLILIFFLGTVLLFIIQLDYYARLFLIVYVGAIVVLFLFIIRRLELKLINIVRRLNDIFSFKYMLVAFFIISLLCMFSFGFFDIKYFILYQIDNTLNNYYTESINYIN